MKTCKLKDCDNKVYCKSVCLAHYERMIRHGSYERLNVKRGIVGKGRNEYQRLWGKITGAKSILFMHKVRFGGLREAVLIRDNYMCQVCGMTNEEHKLEWGIEITVDHIDGTGRYSDWHNHSMDNLWTLCLRCHGAKDSLRYWLSIGKPIPQYKVDLYRLELG